jgi:hypothetical protein
MHEEKMLLLDIRNPVPTLFPHLSVCRHSIDKCIARFRLRNPSKIFTKVVFSLPNFLSVPPTHPFPYSGKIIQNSFILVAEINFSNLTEDTGWFSRALLKYIPSGLIKPAVV